MCQQYVRQSARGVARKTLRGCGLGVFPLTLDVFLCNFRLLGFNVHEGSDSFGGWGLNPETPKYAHAVSKSVHQSILTHPLLLVCSPVHLSIHTSIHSPTHPLYIHSSIESLAVTCAVKNRPFTACVDMTDLKGK